MAFFSEIKASLGLDITEFEKELAAATNDAKKAEKEIAAATVARVESSRGAVMKGIQDEQSARQKMMEKADRGFKALAAAAGINMQDIAQGIARFVTGYSKEQEESLKNLVASTESVANQVEGNLANAQKKNASLADELAKKEEAKRVSRLSLQERENELIAERDKKRSESGGTSTKALNAKLRILEIEKELEQITDLKIKKEVDAGKKIADAEEQKKKDEAERAKKVNDELESFFERVDRIADETNKKASDAAKERTNELEQQQKTLLDQKKTIEQTLAAQAQSKKASLSDIASGKRKVGVTAGRQARELEKMNATELNQIDALSVSEDQVASMPESWAKEQAKAEGRRRREALEKTQKRRGELERALTGKTSDNFGSKQVDELKKVNTELGKVTTALTPKPIAKSK